MNKIIFLKNIEQLQHVESHNPFLLKTHKVITNSLLVYSKLRSTKCCIETASKYLNADGFISSLNKARELSTEWYKPFKHLLEYKSINLGELARIDNIYFFREVLASTYVINSILNNGNINEIVLFSAVSIPCIWDSRQNGSSNTFEAVVLYNAELKNIPVKKLFLSNCNEKVLPYAPIEYIKNKFNNLCDFNYIKLKHYFPISSKWHPKRIEFKSFKREDDKKLVLGFGVDSDLMILWPNLRILSDSGRFQQLLINADTTLNISTDRAGLYLDDKFIFVALEDVYSFFHGRKKEKNDLDKARQNFDNTCFEWIPLVEPFKNPYLKFQFDFLWDNYFPSAISLIDVMSNLIKNVKPDIIMSDDMMSYPQRILVKLAKLYGIKSVSIPHGWVGDIDEFDFESDLYLSWGELSKKQLINEFDKEAEDIKVVGALQFNKFAKEFSSNTKPSNNIKEKFGIRTGIPLVMFLTCNFVQVAFNNTDFERFFSTWDTIKEYVSANPDIDFIIKPHPNDDCIWYKDFISYSNLANIKLIEGVRLEELLPAVDIAISVKATGTSAYLVLLASKPLVFLNSSSSYDFSTINDWSHENGILSVVDEKKLPNVINKILSDKSFSNECIRREKAFLEQSLKVKDGKVEKRILEAINLLC